MLIQHVDYVYYCYHTIIDNYPKFGGSRTTSIASRLRSIASHHVTQKWCYAGPGPRLAFVHGLMSILSVVETLDRHSSTKVMFVIGIYNFEYIVIHIAASTESY
jgi:hypothetical protein